MGSVRGSNSSSCGVGIDVQPIEGSSHSIITIAGMVARHPLSASANSFSVLESMEPMIECAETREGSSEVDVVFTTCAWATVGAGGVIYGARAAGMAARATKERARGPLIDTGSGDEGDDAGRMSFAAAKTQRLAKGLRTKIKTCRFLSQNVDGLTVAKLSELLHVDPKVNVVMLQETQEFGLAHMDVFPGWHLFWEAAEVGPNGGASGGVAIAVRLEAGVVPYEVVATPLGGNMVAVRRGAKGSQGVVFASFYRQVAETTKELVTAWVDTIAGWAKTQRAKGDVVLMAGDANLDFLNPHVAVPEGMRGAIASQLEMAGLMIASREGAFRKMNTRVPHSHGQAGSPAQLDWVVTHTRAFNLYKARVLKIQRLKVPVVMTGAVDEERWLSDHSAVTGSIDVVVPWKVPKMPVVEAWNERLLFASEELQEKFSKEVMAHQEMVDIRADVTALGAGAPREDLSSVVKRLEDVHAEVAERLIGKSKVRMGAKAWWHDEVASAYKCKQNAHAAWKRAVARGGAREEGSLMRMEMRWKKQRTYFRKLQAEKKQKAMRKLAEEVKKDTTGQTAKKVHMAFNKMTASSMGEQGMGMSATLEFPMGGLSETAETEEKVGELVSTFTRVNSSFDADSAQFNKPFMMKVAGAVQHVKTLTPEQQGSAAWCEKQIDSAEVARAVDKLRKTKLHKSCGIDGVTNWMIVFGADVDVWTEVFAACWEMKQMPEQWDTARVKYLFKGTGSRFEITNYRPISLVSCVAKLFTMVWLERLQKVADRYLVAQQGCGRKHHGALDQALYFKMLVKEAISKVDDDGEAGAKVYACFTDAAKAYDRVWRDGLYMALFFYGIRGTMLHMIMLWLDNACAVTMWNGTQGPKVHLEQGVRQGCSMSPLRVVR